MLIDMNIQVMHGLKCMSRHVHSIHHICSMVIGNGTFTLHLCTRALHEMGVSA